MQEIKRELRLLVLLIVIIVVAFVWYLIAGAPQQSIFQAGQQSDSQAIPLYTPEIAAQLAQSKGFQLLVSYTDRGFEPIHARIKAGETIRFTNNSTRLLWIATAPVDDAKVYPGSSNCGASALDTCKALNPREFWEFTFSESGTWGYQNNLNKEDTATVSVK